MACRTPLVGSALPKDDPRPERLREDLRKRSQDLRALQGRARLSVEAPDLSFNRPQRLALERPGRLRVEVLGLFDQVAALIVTRDHAYQFYDARSGQLEEGRVDPEILWRVARIDLSPEEAVGLLLGVPTGHAGLTVSGAEVFENGSVAFGLVDPAGVSRAQLTFDSKGRLVAMQRMDESGRQIWSARYTNFKSIQQGDGQTIDFAFDVELRFLRVEAEARFIFSQVELPSDLPDGLFLLKLAKHEEGDSSKGQWASMEPLQP